MVFRMLCTYVLVHLYCEKIWPIVPWEITFGELMFVIMACFCLVDGICYYSGWGTVLRNDPDYYRDMAICLTAMVIIECVTRRRDAAAKAKLAARQAERDARAEATRKELEESR